MTFDPKSLLTEPLPPELSVDGLAAALARLQVLGMGAAGVKLSGGAAIRKIDLVAHGQQSAHFVLSDGAASVLTEEAPPVRSNIAESEMINGETVEIRYQNQDWWYSGIVDRAHKMWVYQLVPLDPEMHAPDPEEVACENTIAEWRRPGSSITYQNPRARDKVSHPTE